jgi:hypothetical protein
VAFSNEVTILCAVVPVAPAAPTTSVVADGVLVFWTAPFWNGSPIIGYRIYLQSKSGAYIQELTNCDGVNTPAIVSSHSCTVLLSTLRGLPFSLLKGESVYAQIIATNSIGDSEQSPAGNGAIIVLVPDSPTSLANLPAETSENKIGFFWVTGVQNGGTVVLDYRISYDQATGVWVNLASSTVTAYTALSLTGGLTYKFRVEARNSVGFSLYSPEISILCARVPDAPVTLVD